MSPMNNNYLPYKSLASAIVTQAVIDYRRAGIRILSGQGKGYDYLDFAECLEFFLSDWNEMLTDIDPVLLVDTLNRQIREAVPGENMTRKNFEQPACIYHNQARL